MTIIVNRDLRFLVRDARHGNRGVNIGRIFRAKNCTNRQNALVIRLFAVGFELWKTARICGKLAKSLQTQEISVEMSVDSVENLRANCTKCFTLLEKSVLGLNSADQLLQGGIAFSGGLDLKVGLTATLQHVFAGLGLQVVFEHEGDAVFVYA